LAYISAKLGVLVIYILWQQWCFRDEVPGACGAMDGQQG
jgi:hypothetical protein